MRTHPPNHFHGSLSTAPSKNLEARAAGGRAQGSFSHLYVSEGRHARDPHKALLHILVRLPLAPQSSWQLHRGDRPNPLRSRTEGGETQKKVTVESNAMPRLQGRKSAQSSRQVAKSPRMAGNDDPISRHASMPQAFTGSATRLSGLCTRGKRSSAIARIVLQQLSTSKKARGKLCGRRRRTSAK